MGLFARFRNGDQALSLRVEVGHRFAEMSDEDFARFLEETPESQRAAAVRLRREFLSTVAH